MNKMIAYLFRSIDDTIVKLSNWEYIPFSSQKLFYVSFHTYKGNEKQLRDGTIIKNGDQIGEFHIDNKKVRHIKNDPASLFFIVDEELKFLSQAILKDERFKFIKAYYGVTILHPIAVRKGFSIFPIENKIKREFIKQWDDWLKKIFQKSNYQKEKTRRVPKECWISKKEVLNRKAV
ncbi:YkoP family protein [Inediibacterium massiliense]|uniref:YkoP family protein n=1 Tax=Inediibacterium massiliense TaxID=1658111 RepID=UPI0006B4BBA8|nr:hypothetical protein [Inediibacterium massiliense]